MTHHNQTKVLTTWFLNLPLDGYIDNKTHKVLNCDSMTHEAQLEDPKTKKKTEEDHLEEGEAAKPISGVKKRQNQRKSKEKLKIKLSLTISMQALPLI
jgi:hypothetical protein